MRVLVTGGSGFVGKRLQRYKSNWAYISSKDCNLMDQHACDQMLRKYKPDAIIHLAARVGGIKENAENQATFYYENVTMNTNLLECAYRNNVKRVLSSLSTCAFPNILCEYPFSEKDIFNGPPAETNFSYGYAKRSLHVQSLSYRKQYGVNYSTFCPSNVYGPNDSFNDESSHFVAALIKKFAEAKNGDTLCFWGTGKPLRQQLYVDDLVKILPVLLEKHNSDIPLIVALKENLSIENMVQACLRVSKKNVDYYFDGSLDGQYRKDGDNSRLLKLIGEFKFTSFEEGVKKTYEWYNGN